MAQRAFDYSESPFAVGQNPPADHVATGQDTSAFSLISPDDSGWSSPITGSTVLRMTRGGLNTSLSRLSWNFGEGADIASEGGDQEILIRFYRGNEGSSPIRFVIALRGQDSSPSNYHMIGIRSSSDNVVLSLASVIDGSITTHQESSSVLLADLIPLYTECWMLARSRDVGTDVELSIKLWQGSVDNEPTNWDLQTTTTHLNGLSGNVGYVFTRGEFFVDRFHVGTSGDPAQRGMTDENARLAPLFPIYDDRTGEILTNETGVRLTVFGMSPREVVYHDSNFSITNGEISIDDPLFKNLQDEYLIILEKGDKSRVIPAVVGL